MPDFNIDFFFFVKGQKWLRYRWFCTQNVAFSNLYEVDCSLYEVDCSLYEVDRNLYKVAPGLYEEDHNLYEVVCNLYEVDCNLYEVDRNLYEVDIFLLLKSRKKSEKNTSVKNDGD